MTFIVLFPAVSGSFDETNCKNSITPSTKWEDVKVGFAHLIL